VRRARGAASRGSLRRGSSRGTRRRRAPYRIFDHAADVGVEVRARTLQRLFERATRALLDLGGGRAAVEPRRRLRMRVAGASLEDLLVRWLSEILYRQETDGWRFRSCVVEALDRRRLRARGVAMGERLDAARHAPLREVKAVTYHQMRVERARGLWRVRVIFDV
jgi:SHS2 domain-containing protein